MSDDLDLRLKALLAVADRAPDEAFALRVERRVLAESRLRAARRAAWTRFAAEMLATASLLLAFTLMARPGPADSGSYVPLFSPAAAGLLLLALWVTVSIRPGGASTRH